MNSSVQAVANVSSQTPGPASWKADGTVPLVSRSHKIRNRSLTWASVLAWEKLMTAAEFSDKDSNKAARTTRREEEGRKGTTTSNSIISAASLAVGPAGNHAIYN